MISDQELEDIINNFGGIDPAGDGGAGEWLNQLDLMNLSHGRTEAWHAWMQQWQGGQNPYGNELGQLPDRVTDDGQAVWTAEGTAKNEVDPVTAQVGRGLETVYNQGDPARFESHVIGVGDIDPVTVDVPDTLPDTVLDTLTEDVNNDVTGTGGPEDGDPPDRITDDGVAVFTEDVLLAEGGVVEQDPDPKIWTPPPPGGAHIEPEIPLVLAKPPPPPPPPPPGGDNRDRTPPPSPGVFNSNIFDPINTVSPIINPRYDNRNEVNNNQRLMSTFNIMGPGGLQNVLTRLHSLE